MFKLIVLAALMAFAAADPKPGYLAAAPLAYSAGYAGYVAPAGVHGVLPAAYSAYSAYPAYSTYSNAYSAPLIKSAYSPLAYSSGYVASPYAYTKFL